MTNVGAYPTHRAARALTLVELLAALVILSVFVVAASSWTIGAARLTATADRATDSTRALAAAAELLRQDIQEAAIAPGAAPAPGSAPAPRREGRVSPILPFGVVVRAEEGSITLVTASRAPGDGDGVSADVSGAAARPGAGAGWRTVVWRYDAARGELLRGSWAYERSHVATPPIAQAGAPGVRVALRGLAPRVGFGVKAVDVVIEDEQAAALSNAKLAPKTVRIAEISLASDDRDSVVVGPVDDSARGAR